MIQHTVARLAWTVWGLTVASVVGFVVFGALAHTMAASEYTIFPVVVMGFATVGTLIVARRGGNTIGWVFSWFALAGSFGYLAGNYAAYGIDAAPGSVPAATLAAWIGRSAFAATLLPLPLMFLLFPDGRVPTRRWRPVLWIILAAAGVTWVGFSFSPGPINAGFTELAAPVDNPLGLPGGWKPAVEAVTTTTGFVVLAGGLASVLALLLRFRRSRGEERQQIRWLVYVGATAVGALILDILGETARPLLGIEVSHDDLFSTVTFFVFILTLLLGIPAACAIAILRYRLYDLDVVIKKTVVYGVLAAFMTLVYVLVALLIPLALVGSGDPLSGPLPIVAALIIAVTFQPVRSRARKLANRIVYGERATPYEVLSDFSERVAGAYSTDDVLPRMAQIMAAGTGATRARVWLRVANELRPAASWPAGDGGMRERLTLSGDDLPKFPGANHAFAVRHQGELLGALTVAVPASDPLTPSQEKLLQDLAAQAGLVLRNVRLIEELRASRQRLVAAQDEERRKIERNLHDGAQQQLVALSVKLRLALTEAEREEAPKTREVLGQLQAETS
ncbi:MAG: histidine kinase, partial [Actinomycetota bacterium]